jgi:hypothetical protein
VVLASDVVLLVFLNREYANKTYLLQQYSPWILALKNNIYEDYLCAPPSPLFVCLLSTHEDSHEDQTMTFPSTLSVNGSWEWVLLKGDKNAMNCQFYQSTQIHYCCNRQGMRRNLLSSQFGLSGTPVKKWYAFKKGLQELYWNSPPVHYMSDCCSQRFKIARYFF